MAGQEIRATSLFHSVLICLQLAAGSLQMFMQRIRMRGKGYNRMVLLQEDNRTCPSEERITEMDAERPEDMVALPHSLIFE